MQSRPEPDVKFTTKELFLDINTQIRSLSTEIRANMAVVTQNLALKIDKADHQRLVEEVGELKEHMVSMTTMRLTEDRIESVVRTSRAQWIAIVIAALAIIANIVIVLIKK